MTYNDNEKLPVRGADAPPPFHPWGAPGSSAVTGARDWAGAGDPIALLLEKMRHGPVREVMSSVFRELYGLVDRLRPVEESLFEPGSWERILRTLKAVDADARSLLAYIQNHAIEAVSPVSPALAGVLDGTCFAVRHELGRAFEQETAQAHGAGAAGLSAAVLGRACGLLTNCFQQSAITLAQVFDPRLRGAELFSDYRSRLEQSLILHGELMKLILAVKDLERRGGLHAYLSLAARLRVFRADFMHFLMYRDWDEFGGFVSQVLAVQNMAELQPLLHRFARYLETLSGQVRMRAVLNDKQIGYKLL